VGDTGEEKTGTSGHSLPTSPGCMGISANFLGMKEHAGITLLICKQTSMISSEGLHGLPSILISVIKSFMPSPYLLAALALGFVVAIIIRIKKRQDK